MNTEWRRCVGRLVSILPSHIFKIALQYLVALLWSRKETCNLRHQRMHLRHPVEIFRLARGWKDVQRRKKTLNLKEPYNLWARVFCGNVLTIQVSSNCRNRDVIVSKSQACKPVKQSSDPQNAGEKICRPAKLVDCWSARAIVRRSSMGSLHGTPGLITRGEKCWDRMLNGRQRRCRACMPVFERTSKKNSLPWQIRWAWMNRKTFKDVSTCWSWSTSKTQSSDLRDVTKLSQSR